MNKIEIDGEYFVSPAYQIKQERFLEIAKLIIKINCKELEYKAKQKSLPLVKLLAIFLEVDILKTQLEAIKAQPIFPGKYNGETIRVNG